eukprot:86367-Hanusia_phi.AAC.1
MWTRLVGDCSKLEGWFMRAAASELEECERISISMGDGEEALKSRIVSLRGRIFEASEATGKTCDR